MNKCPISQNEYKQLLEAWKQCRENHSSGRPFFMLVQWVPIGKDGGQLVCREVMSPIQTTGKLTQ